MPLLYIQIGITFVLTYKRHSQSYSLFHVPKKSSFFNKCLHVSMVNRQNSSKIPRTFQMNNKSEKEKQIGCTLLFIHNPSTLHSQLHYSSFTTRLLFIRNPNTLQSQPHYSSFTTPLLFIHNPTTLQSQPHYSSFTTHYSSFTTPLLFIHNPSSFTTPLLFIHNPTTLHWIFIE